MTPTDPTRPLTTEQLSVIDAAITEGFLAPYEEPLTPTRDRIIAALRSRGFDIVPLDAERAALPPAALRDGEAIRAIFQRHGWAISMDDDPGQPLDPFPVLAAALLPVPAPTPVEPQVDDLGAAWAEAEAAVRAIGGWFIVTSYDDLPGIYTVEARRWIVGARHPDALVDQPARIFKQPLIPALRSLAARLAATKAGPEPASLCGIDGCRNEPGHDGAHWSP